MSGRWRGWLAAAAVIGGAGYTVGAQIAATWLGAAVTSAGAERRVSLTFDDGPDPDYTPRILDALARRDVRATFFLVGGRARALAGVARSIADAGHDVANHTESHVNLWLTPPRRTREEIVRAQRSIAEATGDRPVFFRPPWGKMNAAALRVCDEERLTPVLWNIRGEGFLWRPSAERMAREVVSRGEPGAIICLHDRGGFPDTPARVLQALPAIIDGLRDRGLDPVPLRDLLTSGIRFS
jgi:peptidoglycan/xylan/chitin deacetylase (PgdA/CDA1 family)